MRQKAKPYVKLRAAMVERGLTQKDLARILGISTTALSAKFTGKTNFTFKDIKVLKAALQLETVDEYFFAE